MINKNDQRIPSDHNLNKPVIQKLKAVYSLLTFVENVNEINY